MSACPDEEAWLRFFEQGHPKLRGLDMHLAGCPDCRALVGAIAGDHSSAASDAEPTLPRENVEAPSPDRVGALVAGKWRIEALAGVGGMGRVYRARHLNGHPVAIKFLHPTLASQPEVVQRFRREGYVANRVVHPAIVKVLDDGDDGGPFLVMELLDGRSCRTAVREDGPYPPTAALAIIQAASVAVAEAHRVGIVHRDLKPDNIFVDARGAVRLLDFGLASVRSGLGGESMTTEGVTLGTIGYMAPEQARGDNARVTARSDVWSLAASAVALMTGRAIHGGRTPAEELAFAVTMRAPPVRSLVPGLPLAVARVIDRALSFEPERRHADAGELAAALEAASSIPSRALRLWPAGVTIGALSVAGLALLGDRASHESAAAPRELVVDVSPRMLGAGTRVYTEGAPSASSEPAFASAPTITAVATSAPSPARAPRAVAPSSSRASKDAGAARPAEPSAERDPLSPRF